MSLLDGTHGALAAVLTLVLSLGTGGTGAAGGAPAGGAGAPGEWGRTGPLLALAGGAAPVAPAPGAPARDTVFPVSRGERLVLHNLQGEVRVETWDEPRVRIVAEPGERMPLRIEGGEERVVRPRSPERDRPRDYRVSVPAWLPLEVRGRSLDVVVEGPRESVGVHTLSGDIAIRGVSGEIEARSLEGEIVVEDSRGRIRIRSLGDDIRVVRSSGTILVEATDGDLHLLDLDAEVVQATTLDGDVEFSGRIRNGGRYGLSTHDGDLLVAVVGELAARVSVSTFDGSFESDFPVVTDRYRGGRELQFTVGGGGAEVALSAFDGEIRLRRSR